MARATDIEMAKTIGNNIKMARTRAGLTIEHVAEVCGVEPVTVSRWESGDRSPSISILARIASMAGVEPGALLVEDGDPRPAVPSDAAEVLELIGGMGEARRATAVAVLRALAAEQG